MSATPQWPAELYDVLKRSDVHQVGYVPDAGHAQLIELCRSDPQMHAVPLTTEEEGIGLATGAWLGGQRSTLLMQSSGVGNCVNQLSLIRTCRIPLLVLVTMRGEFAEFNPWQVPMGSITEQALNLCGVLTYRADQPHEIAELTQAAADLAYNGDRAVAVLLSQRLIGRKQWVK
ncbi:MAG TPA: thiamine pyrophosphate-binding protein [Burkholderiales bacterium]|nr:thiamine pyrophosphate-binding protein [Burkholderiales bacterium]